MVAPFTDLRDGDAENLIYLVLSRFLPGPFYLLLFVIMSQRKNLAALVLHLQHIFIDISLVLLTLSHEFDQIC